ncbi:hypothetical protein [Zobellia laminariae]|uniref:hypothetical protein n=1 Tax=Zobellia laminariae TaxID=248906 RepID=UPI004056A8E4
MKNRLHLLIPPFSELSNSLKNTTHTKYRTTYTKPSSTFPSTYYIATTIPSTEYHHVTHCEILLHNLITSKNGY